MIDVGKVAMIPIDKIIVNDRARVEMGDLDSLEESIKTSGLVQPLSVMELDNGKYQLLAGERRYRVLKRNNVDMVPARIYKSLSPLEAKAVELAENFYRKNFEFWEYDALIKQIHELQLQIHGPRVSTAKDAKGWSQEKTAELIGISRPAVTMAIKRAEAMEAMPELFKGCKNQSEADKVLSRLNETIIKEVIAAKIENEIPPETAIKKLANSYIIDDFFYGVKKVPDNSVHMVEIDPPYSIDLTTIKNRKGPVEASDLDSYNEIDPKDYPEFLERTFTECYRVMSEHSWLICWFAPEPWFETVYQLLTKVGFRTDRKVGIWVKKSGQCKSPNVSLANAYEMFFYARKGTPALAKVGRINVFQFDPVPFQKKTHPTERPVDLMKEIYSTFTWSGARLLIPFLGSGNGLIAAHQLGINAFGFEISKAYRDAFLLKINSV